MKMRRHKDPSGTRYTRRHKRKDICTVIDRLTTTNDAGEVVSLRYVSTHVFLGQIVKNIDVVEASIAMGNPILPTNLQTGE